MQLVNSSTHCVYPLNKVFQKPNFKHFDEVQIYHNSFVNYDFGGGYPTILHLPLDLDNFLFLFFLQVL